MRAIAIAVCLFAGQRVVEAQIKVHLEVAGGDRDDAIVSSYFRSELRRLADVELVRIPSDAVFRISVVAMPLTMGGRVVGYGFSFVLLTGVEVPNFSCFDIEHHELRSSTTREDVRRSISEFVAEIDTRFFERRR